MIRLEDYRLAGRIGKPHGHSGAVRLDLLSGISTDLDINEPVLLLLEGKPVPFFMSSCNEEAQPPILHFEDISDMEQAKSLLGAPVYVNPAAVETEADYLSSSVIGYTVEDKKRGKLGIIANVMSSGLQELLVMNYLDTEIFLPFQQELIVDVDEKEKLIRMDLPEGLLEIYLEENNEEE
jgi:16S rRNA processing protein RimM